MRYRNWFAALNMCTSASSLDILVTVISVKRFHAIPRLQFEIQVEAQTLPQTLPDLWKLGKHCDVFQTVRTVHTVCRRMCRRSKAIAPPKRLKHRKPFIGLTAERWANFNANRKKRALCFRRDVAAVCWATRPKTTIKNPTKCQNTAFAANGARSSFIRLGLPEGSKC